MYYLLYGLLYLFSLLPLRVLYFIGDGFYALVYYVIKYRRPVVMYNLSIAFPQKSIAERTRIAKNVYHNFIDTFIETIKLISASEKFIYEHVEGDFSLVNELYNKGITTQLNCGHNFNWEMAQLIVPLKSPYKFLGVYMPITNKAIDKIFYNLRKKTGTVLLPATKMRTAMLPHRNTQYAIGLAADQNPPGPDKAYWLYYFGKPTPFVKGPEKNARLTDTAVVFAGFTKPKRGYYKMYFELCTENADTLPEGEITRRYVKFLEEKMSADPDMWLWTHRRWKFDWKPAYADYWIDNKPPPPL
jgi:Kdo2-lipid IVA lauroyltransferase/acyltransferase